MKARWNGQTIASSNETIVLEGDHYFPFESVNLEYLKKEAHTSVFPRKSTAAYYDVIVDDQVNKNAAWYYPNPSEKACQIKYFIAFWKGVEISD